jgi:hypothetical protein
VASRNLRVVIVLRKNVSTIARLALVAGVVATTLLSAATANAGTVGIDGDALHYEAAPGEFNELYITLQSSRFTIQDGTGGTRDTLFVTARPPCERDATPQPSVGLIDAYCPPAGVARIAVALGDGNDYVSIGTMGATDFPATIDGGDGADRLWAGPQADDVSGGPGSDTLTGNGGRDTLRGGAGDDVIETADGLPDWVACGTGIDTVTADLIDTVADDCEQVNIGAGQPQLVILREPPPYSLGALRTQGLPAKLTCPAACDVRADLLLPVRAPDAAHAAASRVVATGHSKRRSAGRLTVVARLKRGAAGRLRRVRPRQLTLRTTVKVGPSTTVLQRYVRLR